MKWIRSDIDFGAPMATLTIGWMDAVTSNAVMDIVKTHYAGTANPQPLADMLAELVEEKRPDLKGCSVIAMHADVVNRGWSLIVTHPSLRRVATGESIPDQALQMEELCRS